MRRRFRGLVLLVMLALARAATAQPPTPFTPQDMSRVASITVLDVSEDGRRIAASVRRPSDNETTDHRRYGDPTYLAPSRVTLQIIDARTGATDQPFKDLVNVRDASWSRDGRQLTFLLAREPATADAFPSTALYVWDAERKALSDVTIRGGSAVALNSNETFFDNGFNARAAFLANNGYVVFHPAALAGPDPVGWPRALHPRPRTRPRTRSLRELQGIDLQVTV